MAVILSSVPRAHHAEGLRLGSGGMDTEDKRRQVGEPQNLHPPASRRPALIWSILCTEDRHKVLFIKMTDVNEN